MAGDYSWGIAALKVSMVRLRVSRARAWQLVKQLFCRESRVAYGLVTHRLKQASCDCCGGANTSVRAMEHRSTQANGSPAHRAKRKRRRSKHTRRGSGRGGRANGPRPTGEQIAAPGDANTRGVTQANARRNNRCKAMQAQGDSGIGVTAPTQTHTLRARTSTKAMTICCVSMPWACGAGDTRGRVTTAQGVCRKGRARTCCNAFCVSVLRSIEG